MNNVYPNDTILIADPPSAETIEGLAEITAMVRGRFHVKQQLVGISHRVNGICMLWSGERIKPSESVDIRKVIKMMLPESPDALTHEYTTDELSPAGSGLFNHYTRLGTGFDIMKHDPRL